jgi:hypothetical protein
MDDSCFKEPLLFEDHTPYQPLSPLFMGKYHTSINRKVHSLRFNM